MSRDMNLVVLIGRLVRDPEIRYTPSGTPVARFSIANGEKFKQNNEWKDYTNFFDIVVWGNQAVNCEKYLKKGSQVSIEGNLRQNRWNDQATNQARSKIEIVASSVQFLTQSNSASQPQSSSYQNNTANTQQPAQTNPVSKPVSQQPVQKAADFTPDPWGDSNFSNSGEDYPSGRNFDSDDDIPF